MAAAADRATAEITRLLEDIRRLRALINSERDAWSANHSLLLTWGQLICEKTDRIQQLQELHEFHELQMLELVHEHGLSVVALPIPEGETTLAVREEPDAPVRVQRQSARQAVRPGLPARTAMGKRLPPRREEPDHRHEVP